jgi:hypothetical protein
MRIVILQIDHRNPPERIPTRFWSSLIRENAPFFIRNAFGLVEKSGRFRIEFTDFGSSGIPPLLEINLEGELKVNYQKFEGAVAPIPGLAAKEE